MAAEKLRKFRNFVYIMFDGSLQCCSHAGKPKKGYDCKDYIEFKTSAEAQDYYLKNR